MSADGLDPRHIEEVLARALQDMLGRLRADAGLVLLRTRSEGRFLVRAPVALDGRTLVSIGELASTRPGELAALYAASGFRRSRSVPLVLDGVTTGELHLLARGEDLLPDAALADAGRTLSPLAFALRGLEAARASEERGDVVSEIARGLLHQLEISTLFPELIRLVARLCPCDAAAVAVYHADLDCFEHVAVYGPDLPEAIRPGVIIPAHETPMRDAWVSGRLVSDPDGRLSRLARARAIAHQGIVASLYIPVGEPRRALLCIGHRLPHRFGDEEVALYRSFVPFLEIALRNAELVGKIRAAYRELDATQERLVRAERLRALGELAAGVAHDVGNVLAIVASHAELVGQKVKDAETRDLVQSCLKSVQDGARSVKQVLDMARGDAPPDPGAATPVELEGLAKEALLLTAPRCKDAAQSVDGSGILRVPEAPGDPGAVREAIVNLLLNAIDATPRGGRIALATRVEGEAVVFSVEDSGPGVPPQLREAIFAPFFTTKGPGHVGLGLAQVARVARRHGGSVRVTDAALGGARFELRLPLSEVGSGPHELPKLVPCARPARAIEVLLVEDEPSLRSALAALLGMRGHTVVTAGDVSGALAVLASRPSIQVVVTDLGLPGRSGWELVDEVHALRPLLPVVVLSGLGALTDPVKARERGVAAVLSKPASEQELAAAIEAVTLSGDRA